MNISKFLPTSLRTRTQERVTGTVEVRFTENLSQISRLPLVLTPGPAIGANLDRVIDKLGKDRWGLDGRYVLFQYGGRRTDVLRQLAPTKRAVYVVACCGPVDASLTEIAQPPVAVAKIAEALLESGLRAGQEVRLRPYGGNAANAEAGIAGVLAQLLSLQLGTVDVTLWPGAGGRPTAPANRRWQDGMDPPVRKSII